MAHRSKDSQQCQLRSDGRVHDDVAAFLLCCVNESKYLKGFTNTLARRAALRTWDCRGWSWCTVRRMSPLRLRHASPEETGLRERSQQPRSHPRHRQVSCRRQLSTCWREPVTKEHDGGRNQFQLRSEVDAKSLHNHSVSGQKMWFRCCQCQTMHGHPADALTEDSGLQEGELLSVCGNRPCFESLSSQREKNGEHERQCTHTIFIFLLSFA